MGTLRENIIKRNMIFVEEIINHVYPYAVITHFFFIVFEHIFPFKSKYNNLFLKI